MAVGLIDRTRKPGVPDVARKFRPLAPFVDAKGVYHAKSMVSRMAKDLAQWSGTTKELGYEGIIEELEDDMEECIASGVMQLNKEIWGALRFLAGKERFMRFLDFCLPTIETRDFQAIEEMKEGYQTKQEYEIGHAYAEMIKDAIHWYQKRSGGAYVLTSSGDVWLGKK